MTAPAMIEFRAHFGHHQEIPRGGMCRACSCQWPCPTVRLLDALARSETARQEAREALEFYAVQHDEGALARRVLAALDSGHQEGGT